MTVKGKCKILIDILMTVALLALMGYHLWGDVAHEWIGAGMFLLFFLHHGLNIGWYHSLFRGKWSAARVLQATINLLLIVDMLCMMFSGIVMSRHVFGFLNLSGGMMLARTLHLAGSFWGFTLMSMHIGLHWGMMLGMVRKTIKGAPSSKRTIVLRTVAAGVAVYGLWAFIQRNFLTYMLLQTHFVFYDFSEPAALFYLDHVAIMWLFAAVAYYPAKLLRGSRKRTEDVEK